MSITFSAYRGDDETPTTNTFTFSFTVNETNYNCTQANVVCKDTPNPLGGSNLLMIRDTTSTGETVSILCSYKEATLFACSGTFPFDNSISYFTQQVLQDAMRVRLQLLQITLEPRKLLALTRVQELV